MTSYPPPPQQKLRFQKLRSKITVQTRFQSSRSVAISYIETWRRMTFILKLGTHVNEARFLKIRLEQLVHKYQSFFKITFFNKDSFFLPHHTHHPFVPSSQWAKTRKKIQFQMCVWVVARLPQRLKSTIFQTFSSLQVPFWDHLLKKR